MQKQLYKLPFLKYRRQNQRLYQCLCLVFLFCSLFICPLKSVAQRDTSFQAGKKHLEDGDPLTAIDAFNSALVTQPDNDTIYFYKAIAYHELGDEKMTRKFFNKALGLNPNNTQTLVALGLSYMDKLQHKKALPIFQRVLEIVSANCKAKLNLGIIYADYRKYDIAKPYLDQGLKGCPDFEGYFYRGNIYFMQENDSLAILDYSAGISLDSVLFEMFYNRGFAYIRSRKYYEEGIADMQQVRKMLKDYNFRKARRTKMDALYFIAWGENELGLHEEALKHVQTVMQWKKEYEPRYLRGSIYLNLKKYDSAKRDFKKLTGLKSAPLNTKVYIRYFLAQCDSGLNNPEQGILELNKAIDLNDSFEKAYYLRSYLYYRVGDLDHACEDIKKYIELMGDKGEGVQERKRKYCGDIK